MKPLRAIISKRRYDNLINHAINVHRNRQAKAERLARRRFVSGSLYAATLNTREQAEYLVGGKPAVIKYRVKRDKANAARRARRAVTS